MNSEGSKIYYNSETDPNSITVAGVRFQKATPTGTYGIHSRPTTGSYYRAVAQ